jgi:hypothetical protein
MSETLDDIISEYRRRFPGCVWLIRSPSPDDHFGRPNQYFAHVHPTNRLWSGRAYADSPARALRAAINAIDMVSVE